MYSLIACASDSENRRLLRGNQVFHTNHRPAQTPLCPCACQSAVIAASENEITAQVEEFTVRGRIDTFEAIVDARLHLAA